MNLKSKLSQKRFHIDPLLLSFLIPCIGMLFVLLIGRYEPFGNDKALLYSDEFHQYYPFLKSYRDALLSGDSLLFNWNIGMGIDYLGVISYYLASPLNLLAVLVPESLTLEFFELLTPVRLGLASLFFAIFLKKTFKVDDYSISLFGAAYGLCAWALGYQWNVMWLDTFALLPLVVLGTVSLLRDKKFVLYTVTLFLSVFCNYYIGLFTCIFVLLLFLCYQICRFQGIKRFFQDLIRIALFSALAIGMTAVLSLPTLAALKNTASGVNEFPQSFGLNIVNAEVQAAAKEAWEAFRTAKEADASFLSLIKLWSSAIIASFPPIMAGMSLVAGNVANALDPTFKEGLPNLYCGIGSMTLAFLFLTCKEVKLRDKLCSVFLLLFFMISFLLHQLDYIWHGFHFTNMIPFRFSFLFSFVMLYMAYRAWLLRDSFKLWQFPIAVALGVGVTLCGEKIDDRIHLLFSIGFLLLYLGILIWSLLDVHHFKEGCPEEGDRVDAQVRIQRTAHHKQLCSWVFLGVMGLELIMDLVAFGIRFPATTVSTYPKGTEYTGSIVDYMKEREEGNALFRAEVTHAQTLNDGALLGYDGISAFTSSANIRVTRFMEALGYGAKESYNRYCFEEASPVSNLFLNLKYMIERDADLEKNSYFDVVHGYGPSFLLENNAYLPLGFLAESTLKDSSLESLNEYSGDNDFRRQNYLFQLATGLKEPVWSFLPGSALSITGSKSLTLTKANDATGYTIYATGGNAATLRYTYTIEEAGFLCLDLSMSKKNSYKVYLNDTELFSETISLSQMIAVGDVEPGDKVYLDIVCKKDTPRGVVLIRGALLDDTVFRKGYDILSASTWELTRSSNTRLEGTIDCDRDGLLYTSVPYNGNWVVEVDGEPVDTVLVGDAMMAVELTKGAHTVSFRYRNTAFTWGLTISLICAAIFLAILYVPRAIQKNQGRYLKRQ